MNILIIGGTRFLGRHLVESALALGHQVTLFNRGQTNPDIFPETDTILGDRETDFGVLASRRWEAVIDTCGYLPRVVKLSARTLKSSVSQYVYISSVSVYADFDTIGIEEDYPLATTKDETAEESTGETYGLLKTLCEKTVEEIYPAGTLILRPGVIVGPYDYMDRFTYWALPRGAGWERAGPGRADPVHSRP